MQKRKEMQGKSALLLYKKRAKLPLINFQAPDL